MARDKLPRSAKQSWLKRHPLPWAPDADARAAMQEPEPYLTFPQQFALQLVNALPSVIVGLGMLANRGALLRFTKTNALVGQTPNVHFSDVAGLDNAITDIAEVVEFLKDPKRFQKLGARMPTGILLSGPPGTGKTLLARAVAGEAEVPFFSISGSDFVEMFAGVGAGRVRDVFKQAKGHPRAIIFIDEIDAIGRRRGNGISGNNDERELTLNQLLVELDGFEQNSGRIVIAATNRRDMLDDALLRPGRFDRQITIGRPNQRGRRGIIDVHMKGKRLDPEVDRDLLALATGGMTGADLENLINEAALLAGRAKVPAIRQTDLEEAILRVALGPIRSVEMGESTRRTTAYHEAGHALAGLLQENAETVRSVTIVPRGESLGHTLHLPTAENPLSSRREEFAQLVVSTAGRVAEELHRGPEDVTSGASGDLEAITERAARMVREWGMGSLPLRAYPLPELGMPDPLPPQTARAVNGEIDRIITRATEVARTLLGDNRDMLDGLANALITRKTMNRADLLAFTATFTPVISSDIYLAAPPLRATTSLGLTG
ncbi:MAG: ATP-dependent metallopeptidase FtsH/Yme1/Tma family protein [Candidatus Dormibacteria bacterium]